MARLVFCEDDPTIQKVIQVALRRTPHEIHVAPDGAAGLALIERVRPDLIFTDLLMPELDGYGLIRALKARPELADVPIVLMSASAARELAAATDAGAVEVMTKPFGPAELRERIERLLAVAAARPTPAEEPRIDPELAPLWDEFATASRRRVEAIEEAVAALRAGALAPEQRRAAEREAHRLAGSLGSFGLAEGSRLAREAEDLLRDGVDQAAVPRLAELVVALRRALEGRG